MWKYLDAINYSHDIHILFQTHIVQNYKIIARKILMAVAASNSGPSKNCWVVCRQNFITWIRKCGRPLGGCNYKFSFRDAFVFPIFIMCVHIQPICCAREMSTEDVSVRHIRFTAHLQSSKKVSNLRFFTSSESIINAMKRQTKRVCVRVSGVGNRDVARTNEVCI